MANPKGPDGKQIVTISPSSEGLNTWFHGAGDITGSIERSGGQKYLITFTAIEIGTTKEVSINYSEPIEIHDGQAIFTPAASWDVIDYAELYVEIPATPIVSNLSGTGNCNLFPVPGGNLILPANGNGGYNVDLTKAVPVNSSDQTGYWDTDYFTGGVTSSATPGKAEYNLLDFQVPNQYFAVKMPLGQGHGLLDVDVYKTQWIHQNYKFHFVVRKDSPGAGKIAIWLLGFRRFITKS